MSFDLNTPLPSPHGGTLGTWANRIHDELARTPIMALFRGNNQDCQELRFCKSPQATVNAIVEKATIYLQDPEWLAGWLSFYCVQSPRAFNPRTLLRIVSRRAFLQAFHEVAHNSINPVTLENTNESRPKVLRPVVAQARSKSTGRPASVGNLGPADPAVVAELGLAGSPDRNPSPGAVPEVPSKDPVPEPVQPSVPAENSPTTAG